MLAVADTGPLHYLVLAGHAQTMSALFSQVVIPAAVSDELTHPNTPATVRSWMAKPPAWLSIRPVARSMLARTASKLDNGERAALALALAIQPAIVLMDDRAAVAAARALGFIVTGTLGVLARGAQRGLLDLPSAFEALDRTTFHWNPVLRARLLAEARKAQSI